jgi:glucosamine--fructose-6-phosphate aminotransferase (isomerizing)
VIEQALIVQSLLGAPACDGQHDAAMQAQDVLGMHIPDGMAEALANAQTIYVAGRNDGAAEEIALKSCEITRQKSFYLEGTYVLHGIEEVMTAQEVVLLVEPYGAEIDRYQKVLRDGVGMQVLAIASFDTPFPTLRVPVSANFSGYLQLMAGWRLLAAAGILRGVDLDKTVRARKVGNAVDAA